MLKNILNLKGAQQLDKKEQKTIQGGQFCMIHCGSECYSGNKTEAELQACFAECQRLFDASDSVGGGGF